MAAGKISLKWPARGGHSYRGPTVQAALPAAAACRGSPLEVSFNICGARDDDDNEHCDRDDAEVSRTFAVIR